jgi:hypothetical protein
MIIFKYPMGEKEDVILGTDGEDAIRSALKHYIFNTGNEKALQVLDHLDPTWVKAWRDSRS